MSEAWDHESLEALIRHIVDTHHAYIRGVMPALGDLVSKLALRADPACAEAFERLQRVFEFFRRDLENHIQKEEITLFPLIVNLETAATAGQQWARPSYGSIRHPIAMLEEEHQATDQEMQMMRELLANRLQSLSTHPAYAALVERLSALESDLRTHVHLEDDVLFPRACALEHE